MAGSPAEPVPSVARLKLIVSAGESFVLAGRDYLRHVASKTRASVSRLPPEADSHLRLQLSVIDLETLVGVCALTEISGWPIRTAILRIQERLIDFLLAMGWYKELGNNEESRQSWLALERLNAQCAEGLTKLNKNRLRVLKKLRTTSEPQTAPFPQVDAGVLDDIESSIAIIRRELQEKTYLEVFVYAKPQEILD